MLIIFSLFIISPIFCLPVILHEIKHKKKYAYFFLSLFFAFLSYLFVPYEDFDRVYYLRIYKFALENNIGAIAFIVTNPFSTIDYFLQLFIVLCANLNLSFQLTIAIISFITIYNFLSVIREVFKLNYFSKKKILLGIILFMASIRYASFLSGIRFYLAISFLYIGYYKYIFESKKFVALFYSFLAIFTHVGTLIFIPSFILYKIIKRVKHIHYIIILSYSFWLISPSLIFKFLNSFNLTGVYFSKIESYFLNQEGFYNIILTSKGATIAYFCLLIWINFYIVYLLFTNIDKSKVHYLIYSIVPIANIFFQTPAVYERCLIVLSLLCIVNIVIEYDKSYINKYFMGMILCIIFVGLLGEISYMLPNFIVSYFNERAILAPMIFISEIPSFINR